MAEDVTVVPAGEPAVPDIGGGNGAMSPRDAATALSDWRQKQHEDATKPQEERAPSATPAPESAPEADATPPQEATGETEEAPPEPEAPPIEPPRSWTSEQRERWASLDRSTQEYLVDYDRKTSDAVRKSQNEAAEKQKTFDAERQKMESARQQYEAALPALAQAVQQSLAGEFADIKTIDDVQKLAREDWARYIQWDAQQKKLAAISSEVTASQTRQANEAQTKFAEYAKEQDKLFIDTHPEFADPAKAQKLQTAAIEVLRDTGYTDDEIAKLWNTESFRSAKNQSLIADAVRFREAKQAATKPLPKTLPPVQRPGVAKPANTGDHARMQAIRNELKSATSLRAMRLGAELLGLERKNARH